MLFLNHNTFLRKSMVFLHILRWVYFLKDNFFHAQKFTFLNHETEHILDSSGKETIFSLYFTGRKNNVILVCIVSFYNSCKKTHVYTHTFYTSGKIDQFSLYFMLEYWNTLHEKKITGQLYRAFLVKNVI